MAFKVNLSYLLPIATIRLAFKLEKDFRNHKLNKIPIKTAKLNLMFGLLYVIACYLSN